MNTQLQAEYNELHKVMSVAQQTYLNDRTPANWTAYLAADEAFHPVMVRMSQARMQAQIDAMSDEGFEDFRKMIN